MSTIAPTQPGPGGRLRSTWARTTALLPRGADWRAARPRRDLTAGVMVGLVALPLALGFGVSSGLGPEAGIVTAVVAGAVAAVFGGSHVQVSGPTGAMTVVLVPIVAAYGPQAVLVVGLMSALLLVGLAYAGAGRFIHYVPIPVVEGFTLGIAAIIALQQVPAALGVSAQADRVVLLAADALGTWARSPAWASPALATLVIALMWLLRRRPTLPGALVAVAVASLANSLLHLDAATIGAIPAGLPAPRLPQVPWDSLDALLLPAIAVAALAALESLLSATVSDSMRVGERHDPDRELFGQGLANLVVPFFGGMPATAAIARTAVNVRSGARSRLAALTHAAMLLVVVLVAAPLVGRIPLAALAGVLIATALHMVRVSSLSALLRSTRGDAVVLTITAGATILVDLVTAVLLGLVVAGFFALRQAAGTTRLNQIPLDGSDHADEEQALLDEHIVAYRLDGPLFFAAAHDFLLELSDVGEVRVVILRMSRVTTIDATGASVLADIISRLEARGVTVLLSGIQTQHEQVLTRLGVYDRLAHERHLFEDTPHAIDHARVHAARIVHEPGLGPAA